MRRRKKEGASISLMPILSIQKCTMGVMVVIVCAQTLTSIGKTADQYLEIAGAGQGRDVVYVECRNKDVLIHPEKTAVPLEALDGAGRSPFHQLLDELHAKRDEKYLVLLIRPDGIGAYEKCVKLALKTNPPLQYGKDALLAGGDLVLTKDGRPMRMLTKAP
jgi:hypothetical protein